MYQTFEELNHTVIKCHRCPRLVAFREQVPARAAYANEEYWRKPVPGYGDPKAWLLILGLAPAAHGGNRTGRLFTGDSSARFLFKALYDEGLANQPTSEFKDDGLLLFGAYMTAVVKCVPPKDKPNMQECRNCSDYLYAELNLLKNIRAVLALGRFAFDAFKSYAKMHGNNTKGIQFSHGARFEMPSFPTLYAAYHPSPQNTNTGKLNQEMLKAVLRQIKEDQTR